MSFGAAADSWNELLLRTEPGVEMRKQGNGAADDRT